MGELGCRDLDGSIARVDHRHFTSLGRLDLLTTEPEVHESESPSVDSFILVPPEAVVASVYFGRVNPPKRDFGPRVAVVRIFIVQANHELVNLALLVKIVHVGVFGLSGSKSYDSVEVKVSNYVVNCDEGHSPDAKTSRRVSFLVTGLNQAHVVLVHFSSQLNTSEVDVVLILGPGEVIIIDRLSVGLSQVV